MPFFWLLMALWLHFIKRYTNNFLKIYPIIFMSGWDLPLMEIGSVGRNFLEKCLMHSAIIFFVCNLNQFICVYFKRNGICPVKKGVKSNRVLLGVVVAKTWFFVSFWNVFRQFALTDCHVVTIFLMLTHMCFFSLLLLITSHISIY